MKIATGWLLLGVAFLLFAAGPFFAEELVTFENLIPPGPNRPDEPFREEFSLSAATRFLDSAALTWQKQRKCFSCHSNYAFLMVRPVTSTRLARPNDSRGRIRDELAATRMQAGLWQARARAAGSTFIVLVGPTSLF